MSKFEEHVFLLDISGMLLEKELNKKIKLSPINKEYIIYRAMIRLIYENTIENLIVEYKSKEMISKQILTSHSISIIKLEALIYKAFRFLETNNLIDISFIENDLELDVEYIFKEKVLIKIKHLK